MRQRHFRRPDAGRYACWRRMIGSAGCDRHECWGAGPTIECPIRSATGRQWRVIVIGHGVGAGHSMDQVGIVKSIPRQGSRPSFSLDHVFPLVVCHVMKVAAATRKQIPARRLWRLVRSPKRMVGAVSATREVWVYSQSGAPGDVAAPPLLDAAHLPQKD